MDDGAAPFGPKTWNFFVRRDEPDLWCAVPAERSVPRFLISDAWRFGGHRRWPPGFSMTTAQESDELNGFYLFHRLPDHMAGRRDAAMRAAV